MTPSDDQFVAHEPCPSCGSKDALARYSDGHGHCFAMGCDHHEASPQGGPSVKKERRVKDLIYGGEVRALNKRGISEETCAKWGYTVGELGGRPVQIANYRDNSGSIVAQKVRFPDKDFTFLGDTKAVSLYGQHLWGEGGRMVVITEGEIDALSVSQLQGNKWPVVSVPNGAQGASKSIRKAIEWLETFDSVILMFDNDEPGRDAAKECAALFSPGKAKIASLPLKDANDMLVAGRGGDVIQAIWNAKPWRPDGIVRLSEIRDAMKRPITLGLPWWSETLTKLTYGRRFGEVYFLGAGTGVGKTDFLTQQIVFDLIELQEKVAVFFLEQQPEETGKRVAGKLAGRRFHVPDDGWTQDELETAVERLVEGDRLFLYDHFGCAEWETIAQRMRYLAVSEGVRIFYLDHLTALAAGQENERELLERIMGEIGSIVKELDIMIIGVSHLATPEGKPHEEGGRVMIRHFKGSRSIGFWSHFMFGLERNQQAEDENEKRTTIFRILKDRYTGQATGQVFHLGYETGTGRLFEKQIDAEFPDDSSPF